MNKLFTKIASLSIGLALAIGVGVAVGGKEAKAVKADTSESVGVNVGTYATANSWVNQTQYDTIEMNSDITLTASGSSNTGKYYTTDKTWRFYANESATLDISAGTGCTLTSVTLTFTVKDNGKISNGSTAMTSGTASTISGSSASLTVGSTSGSKGKVFITAITVNYTKASSDTLNSINLAATSKGTTALESATVKTDKTLQVYLTANYSSSGAVDKTDDATWTATAGTGTASVTKGLITGLTVGTVTISASYGGKDAVSLTLTVTQGPKVTLSRAQFTPFLEKESNNSTTISATGFSGTVSYSASSNSANLTASIVDTNHVQIVAANNIPSDETVTVTVTGDDGNDTASAELKVYLKAPVFTLSAADVNIRPNANPITITSTINYFGTNPTVTAVSGDTDVFTVSVSETTITVTPVDEGEANLTVTASSTSPAISRQVVIPVTVADVLEYSKITNDSTLTEGSKLLFVSEYASMAMGAQSGTLRTNASVTISDGKISGPSSDVKVVELEGESGAWKLKTDQGYLTYSGSSNNISTADSTTVTWDISISSGSAEIRPSSATSRLISYNASSPRFCVYGSTQTNGSVQIYGILASEKQISNTKLTTSGGSITASIGDSDWTVSGFVFEVQYEGEQTWNTVSPTYVVTESVPTSYEAVGSYSVHFKVVYKENNYHENTPFTASVTDDMTPISSFYDGTITIGTTATTSSYTYRGTVISIEGTAYYIQQGSYGILVYGGNKSYATGMKVGDLVAVTSKIINYNGYVVESNSITLVDTDKTCRILGDGTLPSAPIVTTVAAFEACNESTRVTFNGLSRNDTGTSITWSNTWSQGSSHGVAIVKDSTGATTYLYISKYLDSATGSAIVSKINEIGEDDTFDVFQGVMAVNTNNSGTVHSAGTKHLSITDANQITIHTPDADPIQDWIDVYMYMNDSRFDGDGSGLCLSQNFYINAKVGLKAVEEAHPGSIDKFEADVEGDYTAALARYKKWAIACNDGDPFDGKDTIVTHLRANIIRLIANGSNSTTIAIVVISAVSLAAVGGYFLFRKKTNR